MSYRKRLHVHSWKIILTDFSNRFRLKNFGFLFLQNLFTQLLLQKISGKSNFLPLCHLILGLQLSIIEYLSNLLIFEKLVRNNVDLLTEKRCWFFWKTREYKKRKIELLFSHGNWFYKGKKKFVICYDLRTILSNFACEKLLRH